MVAFFVFFVSERRMGVKMVASRDSLLKTTFKDPSKLYFVAKHFEGSTC